jgi:hypothetical protein
VLLAGCRNEAPAPEPVETEIPEELQRDNTPQPVASGIGTPMAERIAVLGVLNKRNNLTRELELKPGEVRRVFDDVVVRVSACERTAPWEEPPETGAFVQVLVFDRPDVDSDEEWRRIFSGWLFKNSPSLNVVEHRIYDVWVKDCRMSFPGEEAPARGNAAEDDDAPATPAATPSPAPSPSVSASPSNPA